MLQLFLTGEGPTDLGCSTRGRTPSTGDDFEVGPVLKLILKLIEQNAHWRTEQLDFSNPQGFCYWFKGGELGLIAKERKVPTQRPSKNLEKGFSVHARKAATLALLSKDNNQKNIEIDGSKTLTIYFHDTDGTRSELANKPNRQQQLVDSIHAGYQSQKFYCGIAAVPKPTSEAWLICAAKKNPYRDCKQWETKLSGNDRSPDKAPKSELAKALSIDKPTRDDLCHLVEKIDPLQIDMPSFNQLKRNIICAVSHLDKDPNTNESNTDELP